MTQDKNHDKLADRGIGLNRTQNPMPSATDEEREQLLDRLDWVISTSSPGMSGNRKVHIPTNPDTDDRSDVLTLCGSRAATRRGAKLRRKPLESLVIDNLGICDFCIAEWRNNHD